MELASGVRSCQGRFITPAQPGIPCDQPPSPGPPPPICGSRNKPKADTQHEDVIVTVKSLGLVRNIVYLKMQQAAQYQYLTCVSAYEILSGISSACAGLCPSPEAQHEVLAEMRLVFGHQADLMSH